MTQWLKQSTAATIVLGPFVDSADGVTPETGLTISQADIRLSKNGGAFAQTNNAAGATHMENGHYSVPLDTTDTNTLGRLRVAVYESGALPVWENFMVVPANEYDSLILGTDALDVEVASAAAGVITSTALADGAITAAKFAAGAFDAVWSVATRSLTTFGTLIADIWAHTTRLLTAGTNIVLAKGTGVTGFNDLDAAGVRDAVGLASANLDPQLSAINAKTTNLPTDPADQSLIIAATDAVMTRLGAPAGASLAADIADLPTNSELTTALGTADDAVLAQVALVKAKTDLIPAAPAAVGDIPTAVQNADALLGRSIAGGADGGRTVTSAFRRLRNRVRIAAGVMTVFQENDTTADHTAAVTTAAGDPISEVDPV